MLLSRFWYVLLSVGAAAVVFLLYLGAGVHNRAAARSTADLLTGASNAVGWYLKDDARNRTTALVPLALDPDVREGLKASNEAAEVSAVNRDVRYKARMALKKFGDDHSATGGEKEMIFDALWAVDIHGRVLANIGYEAGTASKEFEMGGYSLVADAIHGWVRDDAWVFDEKIYRVVAHPVELEANAAPIGAIVAAKVVDDRYAQEISERTGAAVAFFAGGTRVATGAPSSFDKADLEVHPGDIAELEKDADYQEKGRTAPRTLRESAGWNVGAIFSRMPGEAWDLKAGYVVGNRHSTVRSPFDFQQLADDRDKGSVPTLYIVLGALGAALLGIIFTIFEHTMPLHTFRKALIVLADRDKKEEVMKPASFRGVYKKFADLVNQALDKIAAKAGIDRGPADLKSVLGPLPAAPQMSAFAVPIGTGGGLGAAPAATPKRPRALPGRPKPKGEEEEGDGAAEGGVSSDRSLPTPSSKRGMPVPAASMSGTDVDAAEPEASGGAEVDEDTEWRGVFKEFLALKKRLGEPTEGLTFEKFRGTLQRNKDALVQRHGCARVSFRVYEKQGKAALKASPVK